LADRSRRRFALREQLDLWFPTLARYFGLTIIGYCIFVDRLEHAALLTAGVGLTVLKNVWGSRKKSDDS
jgi:hypothetical protein